MYYVFSLPLCSSCVALSSSFSRNLSISAVKSSIWADLSQMMFFTFPSSISWFICRLLILSSSLKREEMIVFSRNKADRRKIFFISHIQILLPAVSVITYSLYLVFHASRSFSVAVLMERCFSNSTVKALISFFSNSIFAWAAETLLSTSTNFDVSMPGGRPKFGCPTWITSLSLLTIVLFLAFLRSPKR